MSPKIKRQLVNNATNSRISWPDAIARLTNGGCRLLEITRLVINRCADSAARDAFLTEVYTKRVALYQKGEQTAVIESLEALGEFKAIHELVETFKGRGLLPELRKRFCPQNCEQAVASGWKLRRRALKGGQMVYIHPELHLSRTFHTA